MYPFYLFAITTPKTTMTSNLEFIGFPHIVIHPEDEITKGYNTKTPFTVFFGHIPQNISEKRLADAIERGLGVEIDGFIKTHKRNCAFAFFPSQEMAHMAMQYHQKCYFTQDHLYLLNDEQLPNFTKIINSIVSSNLSRIKNFMTIEQPRSPTTDMRQIERYDVDYHQPQPTYIIYQQPVFVVYERQPPSYEQFMYEEMQRRQMMHEGMQRRQMFF